MPLRDFIRAIKRRWYVALLGLLLTAGLAYGATIVAPPQHAARGLVLLLPSEQAVEEGGNPLLSLGGLDLPARVLVAHFASESAQRDIADLAPDAEASVTVDESTRGPVLAVDVVDSSPEGALDTMHYLLDQIPVNLARIQQEVSAPTDSMVRSLTLTVDDETEVDYSKLTRAVILAVALGLTLTALAVFAIDGAAVRRRQRRQSRHEEERGDPVRDDSDELPNSYATDHQASTDTANGSRPNEGEDPPQSGISLAAADPSPAAAGSEVDSVTGDNLPTLRGHSRRRPRVPRTQQASRADDTKEAEPLGQASGRVR